MLWIVRFPKVVFGMGGSKGIYIGGGKEGYAAPGGAGGGKALKKRRDPLKLSI